jgi:tight adherence protein B
MGVVLLLMAVLIAPTPGLPRAGGWGNGRRRWRRSGDDGETAALEWVLAVAGELRAGSDPVRAVRVCSARSGVAVPAARAASLGGDIAGTLLAEESALLRAVGGVWDLARSSGAGLAEVLVQLADGRRRSIAVRRTLQVELSAPRATARMMSLLPLLGVALGAVLGADPLRWLTTTPAGLTVLALGVGLNVLGFRWIASIVRGVERSI